LIILECNTRDLGNYSNNRDLGKESATLIFFSLGELPRYLGSSKRSIKYMHYLSEGNVIYRGENPKIERNSPFLILKDKP
jgi:hypothetical protein